MMTEEDMGNLADIIWFIKGAISVDAEYPLRDYHIETLRQLRILHGRHLKGIVPVDARPTGGEYIK